jgi:hypothetical protein
MSLINFYEHFKQPKVNNPHYERHRIELPFRALVACASGGGKTNLITNLLYEMTGTFNRIYIITKAPEPLYDFICSKLKQCSISYIDQGYPELSKMPKNENGLVIFDDLVLTKDNRIGDLFIRGRKNGYSSIYISQSFYGTPKIIRQNVGYVWLGHGMSKRDLRMILSEFALGLNLNELEMYYNQLTTIKMTFLLIDLLGRNIRQNITEIVKEF